MIHIHSRLFKNLTVVYQIPLNCDCRKGVVNYIVGQCEQQDQPNTVHVFETERTGVVEGVCPLSVAVPFLPDP